jgi:hypothetical protein
MKLEPIRLASKKFLKIRGAFFAAPSIRGLVRIIEATLELHQSFVSEGTESRVALIAFVFWRQVLTTMGDVTRFWNKWFKI